MESYGKKYEISAIGRRNIFVPSHLLSSFESVNLENEAELKKAIDRSDADIVVNYAAETNVDGCEKEWGEKNGHAYRINTQAVLWIAQACRDCGKRLYHISTDFVFDGTNGPYSEDAHSGPVNRKIGWYGYTKHLSEIGISEILSATDYCIIRISYPYRARFPFKTDFARNMINLFQKGRLFPLFTDQIFTPTLIDDASKAMDFLIQKRADGIYHVACSYPTTPFDFGAKLVSVFFSTKEAERILERGSLVEFNERSGRSPRPVKGGLKTEKIRKDGFILKTYQQGIEEIFAQLQSMA